VATFGSGIEDKMFALAWNLTPVAQLRTRKALRFAEESSEYCCVWRSTELQYGIRPREEGGQHELTGASLASSVCLQRRKHLPPPGLAQPHDQDIPWAVSLRLKRSKSEAELSSFICY